MITNLKSRLPHRLFCSLFSLVCIAPSPALVAIVVIFCPPTIALAQIPSGEKVGLKSGTIGTEIPSTSWTDYRGMEWSTSDFSEKRAVVYAFIGTQCPLAKLYSHRLVELEKKYRSQGVAFVAVDPNIQDSLAEMGAHAKKFNIEFPFVKDPNQHWADILGATRTPEVCIVDAKGVLRYRGRIDDQYGIGYTKESSSSQTLALAIESILANKEIEEPITKAPGCLIGRKKIENKNSDTTPSVTYAEHVSHILQKRCVSCHRENEIGPMDLSNYDEAAAWASMMLEVVAEGRMPPWHASPEHGSFSNDRRLAQEEIDLLQKWVELGTPRGNPELDAEPVAYIPGWQLESEPNLVLAMSEKPFTIPAKGDVKYQYFVVDPKLEKETWVNGMEIVPGNRAVVHHVLIFLRDKNDPKRSNLNGERGFLCGYVPGTRAEKMPEGYAKRIPADSELIFQVHYTPVGTEQLDLTRVGFWFADPSTITHEIDTTSAVQPQLRIPPGEANYRTNAIQPENLPHCELLSMSPHMHVRGKSFRYTALYPDGTKKVLLDIPSYDFNWQTEYRLSERMDISEGTRMYCEAVFDNSEKNLNNPDPTAWVSWGDQTYEEMMIGYFHIAYPISSSKPPQEKSKTASLPSAAQIFTFLDTDNDDKVSRDQVPKRFLNAFDRFDKNKDQILERSELPNP